MPLVLETGVTLGCSGVPVAGGTVTIFFLAMSPPLESFADRNPVRIVSQTAVGCPRFPLVGVTVPYP